MNKTKSERIFEIENEIITFYKRYGKFPSKREWCSEFHHGKQTLIRNGISWSEVKEKAIEKADELNPLFNLNEYDENIDTKNDEETYELDPLIKPKMNVDDWFDLIKQHQKLDKLANPRNQYIRTGFPKSKKPIALVFSGDWHLGGKSINYDQWIEDFKFFKTLPPDQFRLILMGDLIDNFFPKFNNAEAVFGLISPTNQMKFIGKILDEIAPYIDVACWGNHDNEWQEKISGSSELGEKLQSICHYFYGKGKVDYYVGKEKYTITLSHKLKGHSWFHNLHGNIREWINSKSEIVVGAHKHSPGFMKDSAGVSETGKPIHRYLVQVGTYKDGDDTFTNRYYKPGVIENSTLVLHPDEHKIVYFESVRDAAIWMGVI